MGPAVALFTRDLRVHDNPVLHAALDSAETVVPLFVWDDAILGTHFGGAAGRRAFLSQSLADLDASLRARGGGLVVRRGDVVAETARVARDLRASRVVVAADVSGYARDRERRLAAAVELQVVPSHFVVAPGEVAPARGDHYQVFSAYHRAWREAPRAQVLPPPGRIPLPGALTQVEHVPTPDARPPAPGGETEGRRRMRDWLDEHLEGYGSGGHDDLGADATSRLSPYLHLGCISARELAAEAGARGGEAFVRQLAWRDFYGQLLAANPGTVRDDLRPRGDRWRVDPDALAAWKEGLTGYPLVDAGMRQLRAEGWMHNRARMVTASFLTKHLGIDWREGAAHFFDNLLDGDLAQNVGNWQWVAGTGVDTRPNRVFNPTAQRRKLDPDGVYVRRWVPELADVPSGSLDGPGLLAPSYPRPLVDHAEAVAAFRARRLG